MKGVGGASYSELQLRGEILILSDALFPSAPVAFGKMMQIERG